MDRLTRITFTGAEANLCLASAVPWYHRYRRQLCGPVSSCLSNVVCWIGLLDQMPAESSSFPYPEKRETYKQTALCQTVGERTFFFLTVIVILQGDVVAVDAIRYLPSCCQESSVM